MLGSKDVGCLRPGRLNIDLVHRNAATRILLGSEGPEKSWNLCFGYSLSRGESQAPTYGISQFLSQ